MSLISAAGGWSRSSRASLHGVFVCRHSVAIKVGAFCRPASRAGYGIGNQSRLGWVAVRCCRRDGLELSSGTMRPKDLAASGSEATPCAARMDASGRVVPRAYRARAVWRVTTWRALVRQNLVWPGNRGLAPGPRPSCRMQRFTRNGPWQAWGVVSFFFRRTWIHLLTVEDRTPLGRVPLPGQPVTDNGMA